MLCTYRRFLTETLVERDVKAQETCHLLLKLPLVVCSWKFFSLNVGKKVYQRVSLHSDQVLHKNNFFQVYSSRPIFLEHLCLIETSRSWNFEEKHR